MHTYRADRFVLELQVQVRLDARGSLEAERDSLLDSLAAMRGDLPHLLLLNVSSHVKDKLQQLPWDVVELPRFPHEPTDADAGDRQRSSLETAGRVRPRMLYSIDCSEGLPLPLDIGVPSPYVCWAGLGTRQTANLISADHVRDEWDLEIDPPAEAFAGTASSRRWIRSERGGVVGVRVSPLDIGWEAPLDHYRQLLAHELRAGIESCHDNPDYPHRHP